MTKIILSICIVATIVACGSKEEKPLSKLEIYPVITPPDTIIAGDSAIFVYQFVNRNNQEVKILDYRLSCECTSVDIFEGQTIPKNDSIQVRFVYRSRDYKEFAKQMFSLVMKANTSPQLHVVEFSVKIEPKDSLSAHKAEK